MQPLRFCMVTTFCRSWSVGGDGLFAQNLADLARVAAAA
jgi:hypothetical protein